MPHCNVGRFVLAADVVPWIEDQPPLPPAVLAVIDPDDPDLDLITDALEVMVLVGLEVSDPDLLTMAVRAARNRSARMRQAQDPTRVTRDAAARREYVAARMEARAAVLDRRSVVYYMRLGSRVKIGYTNDLAKRRGQIQPEEVMATEPGGPTLEAERHRQFATLRVVGEWFRHEGALVRHIKELRRLDPDPTPHARKHAWS